MSQSTPILIYGADWCSDCIRAKRFFRTHEIPFEWIDTDADEEAEQYVRDVNGGARVIPVIAFPDGSHLIEPSNKELEKILGPRI